MTRSAILLWNQSPTSSVQKLKSHLTLHSSHRPRNNQTKNPKTWSNSLFQPLSDKVSFVAQLKSFWRTYSLLKCIWQNIASDNYWKNIYLPTLGINFHYDFKVLFENALNKEENLQVVAYTIRKIKRQGFFSCYIFIIFTCPLGLWEEHKGKWDLSFWTEEVVHNIMFPGLVQGPSLPWLPWCSAPVSCLLPSASCPGFLCPSFSPRLPPSCDLFSSPGGPLFLPPALVFFVPPALLVVV